jgi:MOSC domain-containing protein YiiM
MSTGRVVGLFVAAAAGQPMQRCAELEFVAGLGIPGDRYATGQGHWSDPRWPDQQLTLIEAELAEELGLPADLFRRNVVSRGVELASLVGLRFRVGAAVLEGRRPCDPCRYLETLTRPGLFESLGGRGGLRAAIITGGRVSVGDSIEPVSRS